jgi:hypothetical protein
VEGNTQGRLDEQGHPGRGRVMGIHTSLVMHEKIEEARALYEASADRLRRDGRIRDLLVRLEQNIQASMQAIVGEELDTGFTLHEAVRKEVGRQAADR